MTDCLLLSSAEWEVKRNFEIYKINTRENSEEWQYLKLIDSQYEQNIFINFVFIRGKKLFLIQRVTIRKRVSDYTNFSFLRVEKLSVDHSFFLMSASVYNGVDLISNKLKDLAKRKVVK